MKRRPIYRNVRKADVKALLAALPLLIGTVSLTASAQLCGEGEIAAGAI